MFTLKIENHKGEVLELTHNNSYKISSVTGLNPAKATINCTDSATLDGSTFTSSRVNQRNIVIIVAIEGDVEENRLNLYKYVKNKKSCRLYYKNSRRDVYIDGIIESLECNLFEQKQMAQISIICPRPYFIDVDTSLIEFSQTTSLFKFPFAIDEAGIPISEVTYTQSFRAINEGDIETGAIIELKALGPVTNPSIKDTNSLDFFRLNVEMATGDLIRINTNKTQKGVWLIHNGSESNIINYRDKRSKWLQFESGETLLVCEADTGLENIVCNISYNANYEGV